MSNQESVEVQNWHPGEMESRLNKVEKAILSRSWRSWITLIIVILLAMWAGHSMRRPSWPVLFDKNGVPRIAFQGNTDTDMFGLQIQSAAEVTQAMLVSNKGYNTLYLYDQNRSRVALGVDPKGAPVLVFSDRNGQCRLQIQEDETDLPSLTLYDKAEKCRLAIELESDGTPSIRFYDANERVQVGLTLSPEGIPIVELMNPISGKMEQFGWNSEKVGLIKRSQGHESGA